uniref:Variant surface glycoprotein 1125.365 n=1 Tax=Trypanosoma brucei TaxID=5691 RepID=A0A1J0R5N7_9TRYP|nr:variant surface glycoprotein 1125.365 [Trypanosoma brucei]
MVQCAALLVVTLTWAVGDEATDLGKAGNAINDICHEAKFYTAAAEEISAVAKKRLTNLKFLEQHLQRWQLAAAVTKQAAERAQFLAVAAYSQEILQAATEAALKQTEAASQAQAAAHRWAAAPVASATASQATLTPAASAETGTTSGNAKTTVTYKPAATEHCDNYEITDKAEADTAPNIIQAKKLRISDSANIRHQAEPTGLNLEAKDSGNCAKNVFGTTIPNGKFIMTSCTNSDYFTMSFSQPTLKTYQKPTPTPLGKSADNHRLCGSAAGQKATVIPTKDYLRHAICEALASLSQPEQTLDELDGKQLAGVPTFKKIAANLLDPKRGPIDITKQGEAEKLATLITSVYGDSNDVFTQRFVTRVNDIPIKYKNGDQTEDTTIGKLVGQPVIAEAISYYEGLSSQAKQAASAAVTSPTEKSTGVCEGKSKDECPISDGCEYKEGKCKIKEEVKAENDSKTTNTTGSNSFVINKAPLLLAFLLF